MKVLITGNRGLIGTALSAMLQEQGHDVVGLDLRDGLDVLDPHACDRALNGVDGVIHLAAVSRVVTAERDPAKCWATNLGGLATLTACMSKQPRVPWLLFASSREVYGATEGVVSERDPMRPVNAYARSKAACEHMVQGFVVEQGIRAGIARLSNVYGGLNDWHDRVVPAFIARALDGSSLIVEDPARCFDFVHVDDVARGLSMFACRLEHSRAEPLIDTIQFVTGCSTTLYQLASKVLAITGSASSIRFAPGRSYDVSGFRGSPDRARSRLGWGAQVPLDEGLARLIELISTNNSPVLALPSPSCGRAERGPISGRNET